MNKVCLIGRLTKNPEIRVIPTSNTTVTNFTIAVSPWGVRYLPVSVIQ